MSKLSNDSNHFYRTAFTAFFIFLLTCPDAAHAQEVFDSGTNILTAIMDVLTNTWARIIAIIAVVFLGFIAMSGRLSWRVVGFVILGIVCVFGAPAIVDSIASNI